MNRMNRRRFVAVTSVTATSVVLVACGNEPLGEEELNPTQIPDVPGAPPTIAPKTATPGADAPAEGDATAEGTGDTGAAAITIEAHDDFSFSPNEVEVAPGQVITVVNKGFAQHDLVADDWGISTAMLGNEQSEDLTVPEDAEIGSQVEFHCSVPGHRENGMTGTFTVVETSAAAPAGEEEAPAEEAAPAGVGTGAAEAITIEAHDDFSFSPNEVEVAPGQTVTLINKGFAQHDLVVEDWGVATDLLNNEQSGDIVIPEDAEVGSTAEFHCSVPGHRESGMTGTFTVVEASAAAAPAGEEEAPAEEATADEGSGEAPAAGAAEAITIEAHDDFSFSPSEVEVAPGQTVTLMNTGFAQHDLVVDEWGIATDLLNNGQSGDVVIPEDAEVGSSVTFYCSVPGHRQSGMEGTFTVVDGSAAAAPAGEGEEAPAEGTAETETDAAPAAGGGGEAITIEAHDDFSFNPSEVEVAPGQTVTLMNMGFAQHDLVVDEWGIATDLLNNGQSGDVVIPDDVEVGSSVTFYCSVPGHRQSGMEGTFTVVEGSAAAAPAGEGEAEGEATAAAEEESAPVAAETSNVDVAGLTADNNPSAVSIVGTQWQFEPAEFEIAPGGVITFHNETGMMMGVSSEPWGAGAPIIKSVSSGNSGEFTVPADAEVGSTIEFTSNLTEATAQGMTGTITIVEGDGTAAASPAATPAAGGSGTVIEIRMLDTFAFEPNEVEAAVGDTLHFVNEGFMEHDFAVDEWSDEPLTAYLKAGETSDVVVPDAANAGEQYEFYCSVPGHKQAGMVGTITIK